MSNRLHFSLLVLVALMANASAQTFNATRIDGRPAGHARDTGGSDPIIDIGTFYDVGVSGTDGENINGPSLVRLPDWLPAENRVHPDANYYLYFAHHKGQYIRMAWASSLTGTWTLFNSGDATDRAWGASGNNTGEQTSGDGVLSLSTITQVGSEAMGLSGHIASPDVHIDDVNQRFVMYFHGVRPKVNGVAYGPKAQVSLVATSSNGLNFNDPAEYGQAGHGPRIAFPAEDYMRTFTVGSAAFTYGNTGILRKAPLLNTAGETNTLANADSSGGFWTPSVGYNNDDNFWWAEISSANNPIHQIYDDSGTSDPNYKLAPRHFATWRREHIDPADDRLYVFYSSKFDTPESIFLTVFDTDGNSGDPADWTPIGQRVILEPILGWEGVNYPVTASLNGAETGVRHVRDPFIFEDSMGTADPDDDETYMIYTGAGEESIGFARLTFIDTMANTAVPQGDLGIGDTGGDDAHPPTPNPMTWASAPAATSSSRIIMAAATATDAEGNGVQYYFTCISGGGSDSGWQTSPEYTAYNLAPETTYSYAVKARDNAPDGYNETANSIPHSATTDAASSTGPVVIYSETFDGDGTTYMDEAFPTIGAVAWDSFADFMKNDGVSAGGAGSMLLPFSPELDTVYTLSLDVTHKSLDNRYIAIGFTRYGINRNVAATSNRFSNNGALAWIKYGNKAGEEFLTLEGENQTNPIDNSGAYKTSLVNLMVKIDTTGDGSHFTVEFFMDGASISEITTINRSIDHLNYVGISSQGTPTAGIEVDNFLLKTVVDIVPPTDVDDIAMEISGGTVSFSWYGEVGGSYILQSSEDLVSDIWTNITTVVGTNGPIIETDEMNKELNFYRIKLAE